MNRASAEANGNSGKSGTICSEILSFSKKFNQCSSMQV
jgi:hypothetical protein